MIKNISSLLTVCLLYACGTPQKPQIQVSTDDLKTVRIDKNTAILPLDSIVTSARYIKLETDKQSLIGQPTQILFADSLVIVIDNRFSPSVVAFDHTGKYKYTFGTFGKGPGEYSELSWAALTPDRRQLILADQRVARYHYYNLDGTFDRSSDLYWRGCSFEFLTPDSIATTNFGNVYLNGKGEQRGMLVISDLKSENGTQLFPYLFTKGTMPVNPTGGIRKYGDTVYYIPLLSDTVYRIDSKRLDALYAIDLEGVKRPGYDVTAEDYMAFIDKNINFNGNFVEADDYAAFGMAPHSPWPIIYDKATRQSYRIEAPSSNGLCNFFRDGYVLTRTGTNTLVTEMDAATILNKVEQMPQPLAPEVQELINGLTENSNPVIFLYDIEFPK